MRHSILGAAIAFVASTATLSAQAPGTVELGAFGQGVWYGEETTLEQDMTYGGGALLGVFVARNLAIEGAWSRTWMEDASPAGVDGTADAWRGRLVYGLPVSDAFHPLIGVGYVYNDYNDAMESSHGGMTGLLGFKAYLSYRLAFRADVQLDYMGDPVNDGSTFESSPYFGTTTAVDYMNWTVSAGLTLDLGPGRTHDTDQDGVQDRHDACEGTPLGVSVDSAGCRIDTDGDGVFNEDDQCAATPAGVRVDGVGCRVDADNDGVFDEDDQCTGTPSGVRVDATGCRVDADGDGVFDEEDQCAATPGGVRVDATGCRVDTDGDGVFDEDDACAATEAGVSVDARGCPVLFEPETTVLVLEGVTFELNSDVLTASARNVLDRVGQSLQGSPDIRVRVAGHSDSTGSRDYNLTLSQSRAESVAAYLVTRGVDAGRMEAIGYGPDRPIGDNSTQAGRAMNRRVELERIN